MNYDIHEIIDVPMNQKLLESFCDAVGVAAAIIDLEGEVLVKARWRRICTDFHRDNALSCEKCIESDTILTAGLREGKKYVIYSCRNGLQDAASPIIIDGEHVANAFIGQFLTKKPDIEFFKRQASQYGFDEKGYIEALLEIPVVQEESLPAMAKFLITFTEIITKMAIDHRARLQIEQNLAQSAQEILELSAPILPVWEGILATPLIGAMDSNRTQLFMEKFLNGIVETQSQIALIDITGVPTVDTQTGQHLIEAITAAKLLGTKVVLTGVRPAIAQTLVHLGIDLGDITTCSSLSSGINLALKQLGLKITNA